MIPIDAALHKIKNNMGNPVEIAFVRARGPRLGQIKRLMVLYGVRQRLQKIKQSDSPKRSRIKFSHSSKIPLICAQTQKPITPFIGLIIEVDGEKVNH